MHYTDDEERITEEDETYYDDDELEMLKAEADQMKEDAMMNGDLAEDERWHFESLDAQDDELEDAWEDD